MKKTCLQGGRNRRYAVPAGGDNLERERRHDEDEPTLQGGPTQDPQDL